MRIVASLTLLWGVGALPNATHRKGLSANLRKVPVIITVMIIIMSMNFYAFYSQCNMIIWSAESDPERPSKKSMIWTLPCKPIQ